MNQYYDYCDTYDAYGSEFTSDKSNKIKTFSCNVCKQSKLILKKSVDDPVFKCEECIEAHLNRQQEQREQQQNQANQETTWKWFSFF